ncbi:MAG: ribosome small subunit-dependent GTPase A [Candidatus Competibacter sp.]
MSRKGPNNLYNRHQNKRALAKKERAKAKSRCETFENTDVNPISWKSFDIPPEELLGESERIGIVAEVRSGTFSCLTGKELVICKLGKKIPFELGKSLVIGDEVIYEMVGEIGFIRGRMARRSYLARIRGDSTRFSAASNEEHVIAANVDIGVIVATAAYPNFHAGLVDRYLILCQNGRVKPLICLNKVDLTDVRDPILSYYATELGINVIEASTVTEQGITQLKECLSGTVSVLVGNSGVGKSSLINVLLGDTMIRVREVSKKHKEGRHTTTTSQLYEWNPGSYLIDTPGVRSLGIESVEKTALRYFFPEFQEPSKNCKFGDCLHDNEPEATCGVKQAVKVGIINDQRYTSYIRMLSELV